ncbi:MAG: polysaccharide deacetylase family protein [Alphaproteobacteria bacterium]
MTTIPLLANPLPWPNGARVAACFSFDMDGESLMHIAHPNEANKRVSGLSDLRYGPTVGVPRLLKILEHFGIRQTFFVPGWCAERYPAAVEAILAGGHEIGHHGYIHEDPNTLSRTDERYWTERGLAALVKATGRKPAGYRAPSFAFSDATLDILLDLGFAYDASLMGDDVPYVIANGKGDLVELPSPMAMDDWPHYMHSFDFAGTSNQISSPERAFEVFRAEFEAQWEHGGLWIAVWHPFISGRLSRAAAMARMIEAMMTKGGVWFATLGEIAAHARQAAALGRWTPRVERLPYYAASPIPELGRAAE